MKSCYLLPDRYGRSVQSVEDHPIIRNNRHSNDTSHLAKLHMLQMPDILRQVQLHDTLCLKRQNNISEAYTIPKPEQDAEHMTNHFKNRNSLEFTAVRNQTWTHRDIPPAIHCPETFYIIKDLKSFAFGEAIKHLKRTRLIAVSLEGQMLGRSGKLSLISLSTNENVYMFDVVSLGSSCFEMGLRHILEDEDITKVFHDVRQSSDILYHQYKVKLRNIEDTLSMHALFMCQSIYMGYLPKYAVSIAYLARAYLGIKAEHLYVPRYRQYLLSEDTAIWMARPLKEYIIINAIRNIVYLLEVRHFATKANNSFHANAVDMFLSHVKCMNENDAKEEIRNSELLPYDYRRILPNFRPNERLIKSHIGVIDGRFVHQSINQVDPNVIFSRDSMHQTRPSSNKSIS